MNQPDQDDDWAELARELERDSRPAAPAEPVSAELPTDTPDEDVGGAEEYDDADATEIGDAPEAVPDEAGEGEGEAGEGEGQPGTGRKRRRRRRRRRKGGPGQPTETAAEGEAGEGGEAAEAEADIEAEAEPEAADDEAEGEYEDAGEVEVESEADAAEDAGGELLRELIANWNVPSWDDIVGGLYRPDR